eukprot:gene1629-4764_t
MAEVAGEAVVCRGAVLEGPVRIGPGTVVHPTARIIAKGGKIVIGRNNIIEEQVIIQNQLVGKDVIETISIGDNNVFEVGSEFLGQSCGSFNLFECKSRVEQNVQIGDHCCIGAKSVARSGQVLSDHTIVYGPRNSTRIDPTYKQPLAFQEQLQVLQQTLDKYHPLQK